MAERVPYGKRHWYTHMMPEDRAVWERFMDEFPAAYAMCEYDVLVGTIPGFVLEDEDEAMRRQAPLYQKKIDVVARIADQIDIIEVKPTCTMATIGQVAGYRYLYTREYPGPVEPKAVVVCSAVVPDVAEFAHSQGVTVVVV